MSRFRRSWELMKCSVRVIRGNRKLLLFPLVTSGLMILMALFFLLPVALWDTGHAYTDSAHWQAMAARWGQVDGEKELVPNAAGYGLLAAIYLVSLFLATFLNVAFCSQILSALKGGSVSIRDGLKVAWSRKRAILAWSLLAGVVGLIIRALEERVGLVGRWIMRLIGFAWSVASVFVIPVIVLGPETANPVLVVKTSAGILKKTWGESLAGYVGVQFGSLLVLAGSIIVVGGSIALSAMLDNFWIAGIVQPLWFLAVAAYFYLLSVASQVYLNALYLYAAEGSVPQGFTRDQMDLAWRKK